MKRRRLVYTAEAGADLDWIYDTVARGGDPVTASRYEQRIRAFCGSMCLAPERGTLRDDLRPGLRVTGFERRVSVAFVVDDVNVTILRLFYGGRDWGEDLR